MKSLRPKTKTKRGNETNGVGYRSEVLVKEKLWKYGYSVRHILFGFDLLVDKKIRLEVKTGKYRVQKNGKLHWNIMYPHRDTYDVLAIVFPQPISKPLVLFYTKEMIDKFFGGRFGTTMSENSEKIKMGIKSPYKVFGKPTQLQKK